MTSPFLDRPRSEWVASNALAFAVRDLCPVSRGHTLAIPLRLVATWFDANREEKGAILELLEWSRRSLTTSSIPTACAGRSCRRSRDDTAESLSLDTRDIGEKFIELYWRQVLPWVPDGPEVRPTRRLYQATGSEAS